MWSCERGHTRGEGQVLARAHRLLIVSGCSKVGGKPPSPRRELRLGVLRLVSCVELVAAVCKEAAANIELILREAICTRMNVARYQGIKRRIKEDDREQRHLLAAESMVVLDDVKTRNCPSSNCRWSSCEGYRGDTERNFTPYSRDKAISPGLGPRPPALQPRFSGRDSEPERLPTTVSSRMSETR